MTESNNSSRNIQGLTASTKHRPALNPNSFGLDERGLSDLLNFIYAYSKHIQFTDTDNQPDGDWSTFFEDDLAFLLARIHNVDVAHLSEEFKDSVDKLETTGSHESHVVYSEILNSCFTVYQLINGFYVSTKRDIEHIEKNALDPHLTSAISLKLIPHLTVIKKQADQFRSVLAEVMEPFEFDSFDVIWKLEQSSGDSIDKNGFEVVMHDWLLALSNAHRDAIGVLTRLKFLAPELLVSATEAYPYHDPQVSLLIAFIQVFKHAQNDLNHVTKRHLEYYYKEVLGQRKKEPKHDQAHVYFELADHVLSTHLESGALLSAGVDEEGLNVTYSLESGIQIGRASIDELRVIHVANNPSIGIGKSYKDVSNIYSSKIEIGEEGFVLNNAGNPSAAYPFGRDQADISLVNRDMNQAEVGFAISSSVLAMKEGDRSLSLTFKFNLKSLTSLVSFVEEIALNENLTADNAFYKILNDVFRVRLTTSDGWYETESYKIVRHNEWADGEIRIILELEISEPAIVNYDPEIHDIGYEAKWPICEFIISSRYAMYAYSYLKDLSIESCSIETGVKNVRDLSVFNDQGELDIHMPFFPLGSNPNVGSYFLIGYDELFNRSLSELSVNVQWHNLPRNLGGFESYYKEYGEEISNESFKVGLTALGEFHFHPKEEDLIQRFELFHGGPNERLSPQIRLDEIDLEKLAIKPTFDEVDTSEYNSRKRSGFLKVELVSPEMGFGFDSYPRLFSDAVVQNSTVNSSILGTKEQPKVDLPNEAFAPQIRTLSLNYKAKSKIIFTSENVADNVEQAGDQFYHIHPFGKHPTFKNGLPQKSSLLPQFNHEGYLLLGVSDLNPPENLSIYFQLEYNAVNAVNFSDVPTLEWSYLLNDEWVQLEEGQIVSDGTNNFTTSGIVNLEIPERISKEHKILPSGCAWISIAAPRNSEILSRLQFVKSNGARVKWQAHKSGAVWEKNIPEAMIDGFIETRPEIKLVSQPFESFGGQPGEDDMMFYNRVSERLRHKNRAVLPEDFERIILNSFPGIHQVLCLNNSKCPSHIRSGEVKIIVVPKMDQGAGFSLPRVDYNQLQVIEKELKKLISPFVKLSTINPVYEKVRISCSVQFGNKLLSGELVARLEDDLRSFICPWFGAQQRGMVFGGSIERSAVLTFIEGLDYISFVTRLSIVVLHYKEGKYSISDSAADDGKFNKLLSSNPWSVLVPDENHDIAIIDRTIHGAAKETNIDTMKVGADFVISEDEEEETTYPFFDTEKDVYYSIDIDL